VFLGDVLRHPSPARRDAFTQMIAASQLSAGLRDRLTSMLTERLDRLR